MAFLAPHSTLIYLPAPLPYSLSSDTNHTLLHISPHLLLLLATSNFLLPILLSSTVLHVLLLVHHDVTGSLPLSIPHPLARRSFLLSVPSPLRSSTRSLSALLLLPVVATTYHEGQMILLTSKPQKKYDVGIHKRTRQGVSA